MTCPFCAEEIRDAAVVCRFCGASRQAGEWRAPSTPVNAPDTPARGPILLRAGGLLLLGSAVLEAIAWADPVVVAGAVRTGAGALAYHAAFALVYAVAGLGLWTMRRWGYRAVLAAVAVVTLERLVFLLDGASVPAWIAVQTAGLDGMQDLLDPADLAATVRWTAWALLAGWWVLGATVVAARRRFR